MNRIFGTSSGNGPSSNKKPAPTLSDAITTTDARADSIDGKIRKIDMELKKYKDQMNKMPEGSAKNGLRQRAMKLLQQKKMYESQRDQLMQQSFNMEQANFVKENLQNTLVTVEAMKTSNKEMKKQYKKIDINKIEKVRDEMEDLMEEANEIQEVLSRSYETDVVDEADLDAELAALGDEIYEPESEPSYISAPNVPSTDPQANSTATSLSHDEFGLPTPMRQ